MNDYNKYMNAYMKKRYRARRELAFDILGGRCINCGTDKNLQIDHIEREGAAPGRKFATMWNMALDKFLDGLKLCQLLCKDCHNLKTRDDLGVPHGGGKSGKKNCKCEPCKTRRREWMRNYRLTHPRKK